MPLKHKNIGFLKYLLSTNSIVFQDEINVETLEKYFKVSIKNPTFMPIPIEVKKNKPIKFHHSKLRIIWIGRISEFKVHILIRILKDLNLISKNEEKLSKF